MVTVRKLGVLTKMRELEVWERELLEATRAYVTAQARWLKLALPPDKFEDVVTRIYADMRRTLKLLRK